MICIAPHVYIGSQDDWENDVKHRKGWVVIHACKEPYHREALGYTEMSAPKESPEYYWAQRGNELSLNLIDARSAEHIPDYVIDIALDFIHDHVTLNDPPDVLIHCNLGESRAPGIGMLYLHRYTKLLPSSFGQSLKKFKQMYPPLSLGVGVSQYIQEQW